MSWITLTERRLANIPVINNLEMDALALSNERLAVSRKRSTDQDICEENYTEVKISLKAAYEDNLKSSLCYTVVEQEVTTTGETTTEETVISSDDTSTSASGTTSSNTTTLDPTADDYAEDAVAEYEYDTDKAAYFYEIYENQLDDAEDEYDREMEQIEDEATDEETRLEQEQNTIETRLSAAREEQSEVKEQVSSDIEDSALKFN